MDTRISVTGYGFGLDRSPGGRVQSLPFRDSIDAGDAARFNAISAIPQHWL